MGERKRERQNRWERGRESRRGVREGERNRLIHKERETERQIKYRETRWQGSNEECCVT